MIVNCLVIELGNPKENQNPILLFTRGAVLMIQSPRTMTMEMMMIQVMMIQSMVMMIIPTARLVRQVVVEVVMVTQVHQVIHHPPQVLLEGVVAVEDLYLPEGEEEEEIPLRLVEVEVTLHQT